VRDRLLAVETEKIEKRKKDNALTDVNHQLAMFVNGTAQDSDNHDQPIADFFPNCTVFFGDIAGFTAWSSTREPAQVFVLLQTVYQNFDAIAKRRKVFKVETIGTLFHHPSSCHRCMFCLIVIETFFFSFS
jgi:class 3 adenylate cyclase